MYTIPGHHHISMITKSAKENSRFYREVLGLRMVKKTVNQDDPSMYHLFYGDRSGSPGTELTFFEIPMAGPTYRGTNAITRIGLLVPNEASLSYWASRLQELKVKLGERMTYAGRLALPFEDPEGLRFAMISAEGESVSSLWDEQEWADSPVPAEHRILGMGPIEATVRNRDKFVSTFVDMLGYTISSENDEEVVLQSAEGKIYGEIVVREQDGQSERPGKGSVHHLAIRVKDVEELNYWVAQVTARGFQNSGLVDRFYFQSLYFRESNGILIEFATDGPGFAVDQHADDLGKKLALPPFLEEHREQIEARLVPLD